MVAGEPLKGDTRAAQECEREAEQDDTQQLIVEGDTGRTQQTTAVWIGLAHEPVTDIQGALGACTS